MPFINMPIQLRVPEDRQGNVGERGFVSLDNAELFVRFRADYDDCVDDDKIAKRVVMSELKSFKDHKDRAYIDGAFSNGGTTELERKYWKIQNLGADPVGGGDKPLNLVRVVFAGKLFSEELKKESQKPACDRNPLVLAVYDAFVGQHLVQIKLRLAANDKDETIDSTTLLLKLEYVPA